MRHSIRLALSALAVFVSIIGATGAARAAALQPVNVVAAQGSLNLLTMQLENLEGTVTDAATGQPVVGALVKFTAEDGRTLGTAYTGPTGAAAVNAPENLGPGTVSDLLTGYNVTVLGDGVHTPATAHGSITLGDDGLLGIFAP